MERQYSPHRSAGARLCGFTLYELLIALAIASLLLAGTVGVGAIVQKIALTTHINTLIAEMSLARSEAIKRRAQIVVCVSADGATCLVSNAWHQGRLIFLDINANKIREPQEEIIKVHDSISNVAIVFNASGRNREHYLSYRPNGLVSPNGTFTLCARANPTYARAIVVSRTGRARTTMANTTAIPLTCPPRP